MPLEQIYFSGLMIIAFGAIFLTFSVVWRVERKLDTSYKFFLAAIIFFTSNLVLDYNNLNQSGLGQKIHWLFNFLFLIFYLIGILKMRLLIKEVNDKTIKKEEGRKI